MCACAQLSFRIITQPQDQAHNVIVALKRCYALVKFQLLRPRLSSSPLLEVMLPCKLLPWLRPSGSLWLEVLLQVGGDETRGIQCDTKVQLLSLSGNGRFHFFEKASAIKRCLFSFQVS